MPKTVLNQNYPVGNPTGFPAPWTRQFRATVYQGDQTDATRFQNSAAYGPNVFLPTGSIACINKDNEAVLGSTCLEATGNNRPVPYIVYVGNDKMEVQSEYMNTAGGIVTLLPCTGYYRIRTTVFDSTITDYAVNDMLTVKDITINGKTTSAVTKENAIPYTNVIVGIVDSGVALDHSDLKTLSFTCYYLPKQA